MVAFTTSAIPTVTAVEVNGPENATPETTVVYTASVSGTEFANRGVVWSISTESGNGNVTIDQYGRVSIPSDAGGEWTIVAVSSMNSAVSGSKTLTIS